MQLDMDCVRDVLLALEQLTDVDENHLHRRVTTERSVSSSPISAKKKCITHCTRSIKPTTSMAIK